MSSSTIPELLDQFPGDEFVLNQLTSQNEILKTKIQQCKLLVVGAGGIGCELLKTLALLGFSNITLVDLDTIDYSNLHRQFLFQLQDVGKSKSLVAKEAICKKFPQLEIDAHFGNIMDVKRFPCKFFGQFTVIINGLDNLEARRYVNRMAVMFKVPMIESGTAGMLGQSRMILPDISECFDCREHPVPTTFPICTIRSTPTMPVHCIVWAKDHLFPAVFGDTKSEDDVNFDLIEDESVKESLCREQAFFKYFHQINSPEEKADALLEVVFGKDIEYLAFISEMWTAANRPLPTKIDKDSCPEWQLMFRKSLFSLKKRNEAILFDKDDEDVMEFVAAAANLRAYCFGIPLKSVFELKAIAGNIIPAISTTNAIAATLAVSHLMNYLEGREELSLALCKTIYISNTDQILGFERGNPPNQNCSVCSTHRAILQLSSAHFTSTKLSSILELVNDNFTVEDLDDLQLRIGSRIIYDAFELDQNREKNLSDLGIQDGILLTADIGNKPIYIAVVGEDKDCVELKLKVLKKVQFSKRIKLEEEKETVETPSDKIIDLDDSDDLEIL
jgi:ubiquitin-like 1-activating enzyme E1 B